MMATESKASRNLVRVKFEAKKKSLSQENATSIMFTSNSDPDQRGESLPLHLPAYPATDLTCHSDHLRLERST